MSERRWLLDASAMAHVYGGESATLEFKHFYANATGLFTTEICLIEAMGVLKRHWQRGRLPQAEYMFGCERLLTDAGLGRIAVLRMDIFEPRVQRVVRNLAEDHRLDFSDALQLYALECSRGQPTVSHATLITADSGLAKAAKTLAMRVWHCRDEPKPSDA